MEPTHLFMIVHVLLYSPAAGGAMVVMAGTFSSSPGRAEPLPMKAHFGAFLRVPSQYVCGAVCCLSSHFYSRCFP
jgi:hypothetical protein